MTHVTAYQRTSGSSSGGSGFSSPLTNFGDLIVGTTLGGATNLPIGTLGQRLTIGYSSTIQWQDKINPSTAYFVYADFLTGQGAGQTVTNGIIGETNVWCQSSGTGAGGTDYGASYGSYTNPGVVGLNSGTTSSGFALLGDGSGGVKNFYLGGGIFTLETNLALTSPGGLSNTFLLTVGLVDSAPASAASSAGTNGAYLYYSSSVNNGNWVACTASSSSTTSTSLLIAPVTTGWQKVAIQYVPGTTPAVNYFIGGSLQTTIFTNIPSNSTPQRLMIAIQKATGTSAVILYCDYVKALMELTTPR